MRASLARFLPAPRRLLNWGVAAVGLMCVGYATWLLQSHATGHTPADTHNYILAGLRLNAGHPLYGYGPGDEHILPISSGADYRSSRRPWSRSSSGRSSCSPPTGSTSGG